MAAPTSVFEQSLRLREERQGASFISHLSSPELTPIAADRTRLLLVNSHLVKLHLL